MLSVSLSGITCDDYDQSVYFSALDDYLSEAAFEESSCVDVSRRRAMGSRGGPNDKERRLDATTTVDIVTPLSMAKIYETDDCSIMCLITETMQAQVSSGNFTTTIIAYANARRRQLAGPGGDSDKATALRRLDASSGMGAASAESISEIGRAHV